MRKQIPELEELKIELTRCCPLECIHCSVSANISEKHVASLRQIERMLSEFASMGGRTVIFTGGEPLLYQNLQELVRWAKSKSLAVKLYTTGILPSGETIRPALEELSHVAGIVDEFIVCLHGASEGLHDQISTVKGSFAATMSAIKQIRELGRPVVVHHVPLQPNVCEFTDLCGLVESLGLSTLKVLRFVAQGRGLENESELRLNSDGIACLLEHANVAALLFPGVSHDFGAPYRSIRANSIGRCGAGVNTLSVSANLDCTPCDGFKSLACGAFCEPLGDRSLGEYWETSELLSRIRALRSSGDTGKGCLAQAAAVCGQLAVAGDDPLVIPLSPVVSK